MSYPLMIDLHNKRCTVVGGGPVAQRKVEALVDFGGTVCVISPEITSILSRMAAEELVAHVPRHYRNGDLFGSFLAIAATDDRETNAEVAAEARDSEILVNVVDSPEECSFFVPSIVRRGDLVVAVSTGGRAPALSKNLRKKLEEIVGPEYCEFLRLIGELRDRLRASGTSQEQTQTALESFLSSDVVELLRSGQLDAAEDRTAGVLSAAGVAGGAVHVKKVEACT